MDPDIIKCFESSSSSSSTSDDEDILFLLGTDTEFFKHYNISLNDDEHSEINYIEDVVVNFTDDEFLQHFRVSRKTAKGITQKFAASRHFKKRSKSSRKKPISAQLHCLSFLWYAGNKKSYREVSNLFKMSPSTAYRCQTAFLEFLVDISSQYIKMPSTNVEKSKNCRGFTKVAGLDYVLGCIDECKIQLRTQTHPSILLNRQGPSSITLQAICDADTRFLNVFVETTGKTHESGIFKTSYMVKDFPKVCGSRYHILGYAGYPLREYLLTPYPDNADLTPKQKIFNKKHCQTMVKIDNCFQLLKQRFRQLTGLDCFPSMRISKFVLACCVLHNLCIEEGDLWVDIYDSYNDTDPEEEILKNIIVVAEETDEEVTERKEESTLENILLHKGHVKRNAIAESI
ncbi:putative nuclease HARBI1 [Episyrphus balteatus]|uniref:putative nuclease HARBI1 n=1 Tax=Episyrphus balteatus TaxID=286459 RepID=UPI00248523B5|nr:putative nuclease HARBI1 [Episyrphus balteatus]XP_055859183.1 putative nuclease HARBI1 [Episyrphus balteatus]